MPEEAESYVQTLNLSTMDEAIFRKQPNIPEREPGDGS
jgi:hypothetical protein